MKPSDRFKTGDRVVVAYGAGEYAATVEKVGRVGCIVKVDETGETWHRCEFEIYDEFSDGTKPWAR